MGVHRAGDELVPDGGRARPSGRGAGSGRHRAERLDGDRLADRRVALRARAGRPVLRRGRRRLRVCACRRCQACALRAGAARRFRSRPDPRSGEFFVRLRNGRTRPRRITSASTPGHQLATGGTPVFGSPGIVLPVTVARPVLLAGSKSAGVPASREATLVTVVVRSHRDDHRSVAVALRARLPMSQTPVPGV